MRKVGLLYGKIPIFESPNLNGLEPWFVVQTIGSRGHRDEQFYVVAAGPSGSPVEQRYNVQEVLALADWYRLRERDEEEQKEKQK